MNNDSLPSFEQAANWLHNAEFVIFVATGVTLFFYQFSAYKRFRTWTFLILVLASGFGLSVTISDRVVGLRADLDPAAWWRYYFLRELTWVAAVVLATIGGLMFLRDYTRLAIAARKQLLPPASTTIDPAKPE